VTTGIYVSAGDNVGRKNVYTKLIFDAMRIIPLPFWIILTL
jgi:hypothetical protein